VRYTTITLPYRKIRQGYLSIRHLFAPCGVKKARKTEKNKHNSKKKRIFAG
jgi:hypothetical protein